MDEGVQTQTQWPASSSGGRHTLAARSQSNCQPLRLHLFMREGINSDNVYVRANTHNTQHLATPQHLQHLQHRQHGQHRQHKHHRSNYYHTNQHNTRHCILPLTPHPHWLTLCNIGKASSFPYHKQLSLKQPLGQMQRRHSPRLMCLHDPLLPQLCLLFLLHHHRLQHPKLPIRPHLVCLRRRYRRSAKTFSR